MLSCDFNFNNKTEFIKCNAFDKLLNNNPIDHLNGVFKDCDRQTMYNYDNANNSNEFTFIDWYFEGKYKKPPGVITIENHLSSSQIKWVTMSNVVYFIFFSQHRSSFLYIMT